MTFNSNITEKWVLVIDDMEGMRSQLRMSLTASGFAKLHLVGSIKDALERMSANKYDVILCDYSLGDSTDGQQFLEYLRTNDLIKRNTLFIMITAEQAYEKVVAASECAPDDYLLKPFTAAQFDARLEKLLEKQAYFEVIDKATDSKNWARVVTECDKKLPAKDRYFIELCKIKGSALMRDNRAEDAANLYKEVLAIRPVGWARLGLAREL
ncbi:MAG: response regulator [Gallionellaceae bacterium]